MDKKIALVELLQHSILLTAEQKLLLLDALPSFNERQIDALGKFLSMEQQFVETHSDEILADMKKIYEELHLDDEKIYVGMGKPS